MGKIILYELLKLKNHIFNSKLNNYLEFKIKLVVLMVIYYRTNSKTALGKDLVEGIEKDLEKLRRQ